MSRAWWFAVAVAACTPAGGVRAPDAAPAPAVAPALAWDRAPAGPLRYEFADTGAIIMTIPGMGDAAVDLAAVAIVDIAFADAPSGLTAAVTVADIQGRFESPAGAPVLVTQADRPPPATLQVRPDGNVSLEGVAPFGAGLAQVTSPGNFYRAFFPMLPAEVVVRGAIWTDTVRIAETQSGMTSNTTQIIQSTWARDTVIGGRTLAVIESRSTIELDVSGSSQGVAIQQRLAGSVSGVSLWDTEGRFLVERTETGTARGTASLPDLGMSNVPVTARTRQTVRLVRR